MANLEIKETVFSADIYTSLCDENGNNLLFFEPFFRVIKEGDDDVHFIITTVSEEENYTIAVYLEKESIKELIKTLTDLI